MACGWLAGSRPGVFWLVEPPCGWVSRLIHAILPAQSQGFSSSHNPWLWFTWFSNATSSISPALRLSSRAPCSPWQPLFSAASSPAARSHRQNPLSFFLAHPAYVTDRKYRIFKLRINLPAAPPSCPPPCHALHAKQRQGFRPTAATIPESS